MNKLKKSKTIELYKEVIDSNTPILFIRNHGIKVNELNEVRSEIRRMSQGKCTIIKNNLFKIASSKIYNIEHMLNQSLIIAYGKEYVSLFKSIILLCKKYSLEVLFGTMDNKVIDIPKIQVISELGTENETRSKIVSLIQSVQGKIFNALACPCDRIIRVIQSYEKKIKK